MLLGFIVRVPIGLRSFGGLSSTSASGGRLRVLGPLETVPGGMKNYPWGSHPSYILLLVFDTLLFPSRACPAPSSYSFPTLRSSACSADARWSACAEFCRRSRVVCPGGCACRGAEWWRASCRLSSLSFNLLAHRTGVALRCSGKRMPLACHGRRSYWVLFDECRNHHDSKQDGQMNMALTQAHFRRDRVAKLEWAC